MKDHSGLVRAAGALRMAVDVVLESVPSDTLKDPIKGFKELFTHVGSFFCDRIPIVSFFWRERRQRYLMILSDEHHLISTKYITLIIILAAAQPASRSPCWQLPEECPAVVQEQ